MRVEIRMNYWCIMLSIMPAVSALGGFAFWDSDFHKCGNFREGSCTDANLATCCTSLCIRQFGNLASKSDTKYTKCVDITYLRRKLFPFDKQEYSFGVCYCEVPETQPSAEVTDELANFFLAYFR
eukprot:931270_1